MSEVIIGAYLNEVADLAREPDGYYKCLNRSNYKKLFKVMEDKCKWSSNVDDMKLEGHKL